MLDTDTLLSAFLRVTSLGMLFLSCHLVRCALFLCTLFIRFSIIHRVLWKSSPFYLCDNFPNCKPIQIILNRNMAEEIWNWRNAILTLICYASLVCIVKWRPFLSQFHNVKILMLHFKQFLRSWYYHRSFLHSVNHYKRH